MLLSYGLYLASKLVFVVSTPVLLYLLLERRLGGARCRALSLALLATGFVEWLLGSIWWFDVPMREIAVIWGLATVSGVLSLREARGNLAWTLTLVILPPWLVYLLLRGVLFAIVPL